MKGKEFFNTKPQYMNEVTGDTLFPFGEYRFTRMKNVPAEHLLKYSGRKAPIPERFRKYIRENIAAIKTVAEFGESKHLELPCKKLVYINESIAKQALNVISKKEQDHKKPIRTYECPICGGWHLTSKQLT